MSPRFDKAVQKFDEYNSKDPSSKELTYAQRMSDRLRKFKPDAAEHIQLAVRCQHIGRWEIPRKTYPDGKKGYIAWRNKLKDHHAAIAGPILLECGYDQEMVEKVQDLLEKKDLRSNADTQLLEDVVCIVFVEFYLAEFASKHEDAKVIDILRKTLKKMSPAAINTVSELPVSARIGELIAKAS